MFKDREEMGLYVLSSFALAIAFWGFNIFKLREYPFAALLLFAVFFINPLLVYLGKRMLGPEQGDVPLKAVSLCAVVAFIVVWASNPERDVPGSLALPVLIIFLIPTVLHYLRESISGSESDVQPE